MGIKLAREIKSFLEYYTEGKNIKISLIGHSLGGLIIRACLPHLKDF